MNTITFTLFIKAQFATLQYILLFIMLPQWNCSKKHQSVLLVLCKRRKNNNVLDHDCRGFELVKKLSPWSSGNNCNCNNLMVYNA